MNKQLEIIDLDHKYRSSNSNNLTLKSINISINQGEILGLVGPSGCGKTTLLRLIAGFEIPLNGNIINSGKNISSSTLVLPPERRGIGMVFQDYALFPHLNVWDNVCFGLKNRSDINRPSWLLDLLGLGGFKKRYPHQLSGGQRQRLALARALVPNPSIILLDEPFNSLDQKVRIKLRNELPQILKTCNTTAIMVTHDSQEALAICDRIAVMRYGELVQCSSSLELINEPVNSFVGEFIFQKNVLEINYVNDKPTSLIGDLKIKEDYFNQEIEEIMFDNNALSLEISDKNNSSVVAKEYFDNNVVYTVKIEDKFLRINDDIYSKINVGMKSMVKLKSNQKLKIFPCRMNATTL